MPADSAQLQSIQSVDFDSLFEAFKEVEGAGVITGLGSTVTGTDLTVTIGTGKVKITTTEGTGIVVEFASTTNVSYTGVPDSTNPKKSLIVIDSTGAITKRDGTAEAAQPVGDVRRNTIRPATPELSAGDIVLHEVWLTAGMTQITSSDVSDRRMFVKGYDEPRIKFQFFDDFIGDSIDARWTSGTAGSAVNPQISDGAVGGIVLCVTNSTISSESRLYMNNIRILQRSKNLIVKFRAKISSTSSLGVYIGVYNTIVDIATGFGTTANALLRYDTGLSDTNFMLQTGDGTTTTATSSGVAADTNYHDFIIECRSGDVRLWIDGVLKVTKTTNLPGTSTNMQPLCGVINLTAADRQVSMDYIKIVQDR